MIRCWDCREEGVVPHPNLSGQLAREMWDSLRASSDLERVGYGLLGAVLVTGSLLLGRAGLLVAAVLLAAAAFAYRRTLLRTAERALTGARRHPLAMLCVPLVLPLGLVATEAAIVGVAYEQDWLRYLVLDMSPRAGAVAVLASRPDAAGVDYASISDAEVFRIYGYGLRRGYALTWTVPASLIRGMSTRSDTGYAFVNAAAWNDWVNPVNYLSFRALCTAAVVTILASVLSLNARWINLIGSLEARHLAAAAGVRPAPLHRLGSSVRPALSDVR
jgi:hypothetical protein